jgi:hypothetical protein
LLDTSEDNKDLASSEDSEEAVFWLKLTERAFKKIWDNPKDDVYGELLGLNGGFDRNFFKLDTD